MRRFLTVFLGSLITAHAVLGRTTSSEITIRVRLLDYKTGRALRGRCVARAPSGKDGKYFRQEVLKHRTDKAGEVEFHVRAEAAPKVIVTPLNDYSCAKYDQFTTAEILERGIPRNYSDESYCGPRAVVLPNPQPGEVIFPVHELNLWQRLARSLD